MKLTSHARERIAEMQLDPLDVLSVVRDPEVCYTSDRGIRPGQENRIVHIRGDVAVVCQGKRIVTVLWHGGTEPWERTGGCPS